MIIANKFITIGRYVSSSSSTSANYWTFQRYNEWMNVGIVKQKGRAYDASKTLIPVEMAQEFPEIPCTSLFDEAVDFPVDLKPQIRLVGFSFKQYGFTLVKSYSEPFKAKFMTNPKVSLSEICYVEHGFLSIAKGLFTSNLKKIMPQDQVATTYVTFGNVKDFARILELPNFFTGYAYLLDSKNRVRWKGCGLAKPEEIEYLISCTEKLIVEQANSNK